MATYCSGPMRQLAGPALAQHRPSRSCHTHLLDRVTAQADRTGQRRHERSCLRASNSSAQAISAEEISNPSSGRKLDVSNSVVSARFRSTPWAAEHQEEEGKRTQGSILFVSESNACRSLLAQAILESLLEEHGLSHIVRCESKATRDYTIGQGPENVVAEVAAELGISLPANFQSRHCDYEGDVVKFDLICVMDKFTASDFLKEASIYETMNKQGNYTLKVHRLGEFHPQLMHSTAHEGQDIEDPLYGNVGGPAEKKAVMAAAGTIREACEALLIFLQKLASIDTDRSYKDKLQAAIINLKEIEWLAPPMLTPRRAVE